MHSLHLMYMCRYYLTLSPSEEPLTKCSMWFLVTVCSLINIHYDDACGERGLVISWSLMK